MAVNVITEFGANTKKFDAAVEKSSKKAKKNLEDIGKGARVAGGKIGELSEKFNNLAAGGVFTKITAGVGLIALAIKKVIDLSKEMFKDAANDAADMAADLKAMNQINSVFITDSESAQNALRSAIGKKNLSNQEMQTLNSAIAILAKRENITGIAIANRQLTGYSQAIDELLSRQIINKKLEAKTREINAGQKTLTANNELRDFLTNGNWNSWAGIGTKFMGLVGWNRGEIRDVSNESKQIARDIYQSEMERRKLREELTLVSAKSAAIFADAAEEAAKAAAAEEAERRKKLEAEERRKKIKELTEKRSGISFAGGASQMFTNSLTSRGGWAGGGKVWDTSRYQQQMLQYNAQQQATLVSIDKQLEELQRI